MRARDFQLGRLVVGRSVLIALGCAYAGLVTEAHAASGLRPDLDVKSLVAASTVTAGATFAVTDKVKNVGEAKARRSTLRFTLSGDQLADKTDLEVGARAVKKLRAGRKSTATTTLSAPSGAGNFFIVACADALKALREERERNNCQASTQPLTVVAPAGEPEPTNPDPEPTNPDPEPTNPDPPPPPTPLTWMLRNFNMAGAPDLTFEFGVAGDLPVTGDWDGNGTDTVGVYRPSTQTWLLRNSNSAGAAQVTLVFGAATSVPVSGDWDGDGDSTVGVYDPATGGWAVKNALTTGPADLVFNFTNGAGTIPITGDWDGNGTDTAGFKDGSFRALRNSNTGGAPDILFVFGSVNDKPITGDWDGDGDSTQGFVQTSAPTHGLRNTNSAGALDLSFSYALPTDVPVAGDWDGSGTDTVGAVR